MSFANAYKLSLRQKHVCQTPKNKYNFSKDYSDQKHERKKNRVSEDCLGLTSHKTAHYKA